MEDDASKRVFWLAAAAVLAALAYAGAPGDMPELARRAAALGAGAVILWATAAVPLYATSLGLIAAQILWLAESGGLAGRGGLGYQDFLAPFSSGVIILFLGGLLLARAIAKEGLDRVLARRLLHPFANSPGRLLYGVMGVSAAFSMWLSNTATAAMMLALIAPLLARLDKQDPLRQGLVLAVAFGANIGGLGTPIGTPPNAICLATLRQAGIEIGFPRWMAAAVPLMALMIAASGAWLRRLFPPAGPRSFEDAFPPGEALDARRALTLAILGGAIALWLTGPWHGIHEAAVSLLAAAALTALGVLDRRDVDSIDWNVLILMWGGLALGNAMSLTGLAAWIAGLPFGALPGGWLPVLFVGLSLALSTVMSNTASAALLIPIAVSAAPHAPLPLAILTAFSASFAMALPVSTPPNALAFASGALSPRQMLEAGLVISALGAALLLLGYRWVLPAVFGLP